MNITILFTVAFVSFASGTLLVKYAPASYHKALLFVSLAAGFVLGAIIPPQFNAPVCACVGVSGLIPVLSREISNIYQMRKKQEYGREVLKNIYG